MTGDAAPRIRSSIRTITAIGLGTIVLFLIANALLAGSGLDELWTWQLADISIGIRALVQDRWLHDTHPPLFNVWSTFLSLIGVEAMPLARLLTNTPPLLLMIASARRFIRRSPDQYIFHSAFLLLVLSVPPTVWAFATYRSYFWQIAALSVLVQVGRHIAMADKDLSPKLDGGLAPIAVFAVAGSIMLHYVGGLIGAVLTLAIVLCAMAKGFKRWAWLLGKAMIASGVLTAGFAWYEAQYWIVELDRSWIQPDSGSGMGEVIGLVANAVLHNPIPLIGLKWVRDYWTARDGIFVVTMIAAVLIAVFILFQIDVQKPIVIGRYMAGIPVVICAAMAALTGKFQQERVMYSLLVAVSVGSVVAPFLFYGPNKHWNADAKRIAKIHNQCPSTKVYAATGWLLQDGGNSLTARREDPVYARGYVRLGQSYGFTPQIIGRNGPIRAVPGECPVILWVEHVPKNYHKDAKAALAAVGLTGLDQTRLQLIHGESGVIIRADRR